MTVVMMGQMNLDDWDEKSEKKNDQDEQNRQSENTSKTSSNIWYKERNEIAQSNY